MSTATSSSLGHTPGVWTVRPQMDADPNYYPLTVTARDESEDTDWIVADIALCPNTEANARLIATAPELLETAKALIAVIDTDVIRRAALQFKLPLYERSADLIDAIAKAEGRNS